MELSNYLVSWIVTYLEDLQPTYIGLIIYLLSTMDIPVGSDFQPLGICGEEISSNPGRPVVPLVVGRRARIRKAGPARIGRTLRRSEDPFEGKPSG